MEPMLICFVVGLITIAFLFAGIAFLLGIGAWLCGEWAEGWHEITDCFGEKWFWTVPAGSLLLVTGLAAIVGLM